MTTATFFIFWETFQDGNKNKTALFTAREIQIAELSKLFDQKRASPTTFTSAKFLTFLGTFQAVTKNKTGLFAAREIDVAEPSLLYKKGLPNNLDTDARFETESDVMEMCDMAEIM
jgi:hypothetical protein